MKRVLTALCLFVATPALAQQAPDAAFLQRAITVLQGQRNQAMDAQAVAAAQVATLTDHLAKAKARIMELEPKPGAAPEK
jgi:hypothetical protein